MTSLKRIFIAFACVVVPVLLLFVQSFWQVIAGEGVPLLYAPLAFAFFVVFLTSGKLVHPWVLFVGLWIITTYSLAGLCFDFSGPLDEQGFDWSPFGFLDVLWVLALPSIFLGISALCRAGEPHI